MANELTRPAADPTVSGMPHRLFLLDGMALAYRAHFAFMARPIRTSTGLNTSALFGFVNTVLDILQTGSPTHLAVAFDTEAPTPRHRVYPEYKAQREAMPEDLSLALPAIRRFLEAFRIPVLSLDGYEADDLIGTLVKRVEPAGFESFMVTPDKDFGQLVTERTRLWKPGRQGGETEILGPEDICRRWGIRRVEQVTDMLGLMGDASDNIPGVPGIGEKTAARLLAQYDSLEAILEHADDVKGKVGEALRTHRDMALLSKQLATIITEVPLDTTLDALTVRERDDEAVRALCVEFEFNALGRRLFGEGFKAGRGFRETEGTPSAGRPTTASGDTREMGETGDLFGAAAEATKARPGPAGVRESQEAVAAESAPALRTIREVPHRYRLVRTAADREDLARALSGRTAFCLDTETDGLDPRTARLLGIAFSAEAGTGWYLPVPESMRAGTTRAAVPADWLGELAALLADERVEKVGHNLKFDLLVLRWHGIEVRGPFFDTMIAHALVEPEMRHGMDYLAEALLGYTPIPITDLIGPKGAGQRSMAEVPVDQVAEYSAEDADVTWQLRDRLDRLLKERGEERVFREVEMPVLPALVAMEHEGIRVDAAVLREYSLALGQEMQAAEADVHRLAGHPFNVNSNRQLGVVLFEELRLVERPRKTPTGQYATDEQTLQALAAEHLIVRRLLDHRAVAKLKSTYADALPAAVFPETGRVHTTYHQAATATGRLSSVDPNLQNIPIRTERGQEIRRAFVPREGWVLLSADYSQIELRIIAALSGERAMIEAFRRGEDIHRSTAARVFGVAPPDVTAEMRRRAKMVNFGIIYGISAFGLAQRLGIPRGEASGIIEQYFTHFPRIRAYLDDAIESGRRKGYVETMTGRRRYLPDLKSANATVRGAAERNAINTPIQGTAADMIKIAMARIHGDLERGRRATRLLLQIHDELVFDLFPPEEAEIRSLVRERMVGALPLPEGVTAEVEMGTGPTWLEAH